MFKAIKEFFFSKPQPTVSAVPEAPYKVEAPAFKPTADAAPELKVSPSNTNESGAKKSVARKTTPKPAIKRAAAKKSSLPKN
jgi:hypothetical protein